MKRVLVIEDDPNKSSLLRTFLRELLPSADVIERRSFHSGLREALTGPDLIVLDMTLPTYDISSTEKGGRTRPYGGREILSELKRRSVIVPVVVVTQFESFGEGEETMTLDQLRLQLEEEFSASYKGAVFYQAAESDWRRALRDVIARL